DMLYLSNYATTHLKDELSALPGVGAVTLLGQREPGIRLWLDPDKLAAHDLTAAEVLPTLRKQDIQVPDGPPEKPPKDKEQVPLNINGLGRLPDADKLADLVLKTDAKGGMIRLKDVGRIEPGASGPDSHVSVSGKPAVALAVYPTPGARPPEVSAAVTDRLSQLRRRYPGGVEDGIPFDFPPDGGAPGQATTPGDLLGGGGPPSG